jgi:hypothetical protein
MGVVAVMETTATCDICERVFLYDRKKRTTKSTCYTCLINRHRFTKKWWCVQTRGGQCQLCAYRKALRSLDFHHVDDAGKEFGFGGNHNAPWEAVLKELQKCVLVCKNCHGEIHEALDYGADIGALQEISRLAAEPLVTMPSYSRVYWKLAHPKFAVKYKPHLLKPGTERFAKTLAALEQDSDTAWRKNLMRSRQPLNKPSLSLN